MPVPPVLHERQRLRVEMGGQLVSRDGLLFDGVTGKDHEADYRSPKTRRAEMSEEGLRIAKTGNLPPLSSDDFDNNDTVALHTMPEDARPDWKAAAEEYRRLMRKFGINPDEIEKMEEGRLR